MDRQHDNAPSKAPMRPRGYSRANIREGKRAALAAEHR